MALATSSSAAEPGRSLRLRLAVALAALALIVILAQSLAWLWLLERQEEAFITQQLNEQITHSMAVWRRHPEAAFPNSPSMWLYRIARTAPAGGAVRPPAQFAELAAGDHEVYLGSKEYHVLVREDEQARYILAYDAEGHETRLNTLFWLTIFAAIVIGSCTLAVGYWLAGRLTRRLAQLADDVEREAPGPLAEPAMDRELLALATVLDRYRARQNDAMARERAFAANLSHELRTPLTAIRTDAELLTNLPEMPAAAVRRGNRILLGVDRINALAGSLLLLAREARPGPRQSLALAALLDQAWAASLQAQPQAVVLRNEVAADVYVLADPALLELVLRNVFDNALRYSTAGEVVCRFSDHCLRISDSGPGFAPADLARVFDRFYLGERGLSGIGLALVRHVCSACGWQVMADNDPAGGGRISLTFPGDDLTTSSHTVD